MLDIIKKAFCFYLAKIVLHCKDYQELDETMDNIINRRKKLKYSGDENLLAALDYAFECRKYRRKLISKKPEISNMTVVNALMKSVF